MDAMLLKEFQKQILIQCEFFLFATRDVADSLKTDDTNRIFFGLQNLLNAAANISKALWGHDEKFPVQRQALRESIGVAELSPFREIMLHNNFEYFDQRLEKWWIESPKHQPSDLQIAPEMAISNIYPIDWFRHYNPKNGNLHFWGQKFNLRELITEVQRIIPKLQQATNENSSANTL